MLFGNNSKHRCKKNVGGKKLKTLKPLKTLKNKLTFYNKNVPISKATLRNLET